MRAVRAAKAKRSTKRFCLQTKQSVCAFSPEWSAYPNKMGELTIKYEKASVLVLNVICKIAGIVIIGLYITGLENILLPIGALTFLIPSFGCGGAFFESRCLLLTYSSLLLSFLFSKTLLLMYYAFGTISHEQKASTLLEMEFRKFSVAIWVVVYTTSALELIGAFMSFRLARRFKKVENDYDQFENEDDTIKFLSSTLRTSDDSV